MWSVVTKSRFGCFRLLRIKLTRLDERLFRERTGSLSYHVVIVGSFEVLATVLREGEERELEVGFL